MSVKKIIFFFITTPLKYYTRIFYFGKIDFHAPPKIIAFKCSGNLGFFRNITICHSYGITYVNRRKFSKIIPNAAPGYTDRTFVLYRGIEMVQEVFSQRANAEATPMKKKRKWRYLGSMPALAVPMLRGAYLIGTLAGYNDGPGGRA